MDNTEEPNSGPPHHWPFELHDPAVFGLPKRYVNKVYIDNTGWDSSAFTGARLALEINRWHVAEGWKGITYHYVIDKSGNIVKGRSLEEPAMITKDKLNGRTIVIAVQGLWHFTEWQLMSLDMLCRSIDHAMHIERREVTFHGMSEIADVPSPMFDYRALLGLNDAGFYNKGTALTCALVAQQATRLTPLGAVA